MNKEKKYEVVGSALCLLPAILTLLVFSMGYIMGDRIRMHDKHSWQADVLAYSLSTMLLSFIMPFIAKALHMKRTARLCLILACGILLLVIVQTCGSLGARP